ncbi:MAG: Hsp20/alpha crystallin family protein [Pyrinomonadaceae bacterium]
MNIIRYDPFRELKNLQKEFGRIFSGNLSGHFDEDESISRGVWAPSVDIFENKDQIVIEAELPGMNRDDVELTIENNTLTLRGERKFEKKEESDTYHRVERTYGSFSRSFTLPQTVSAESVVAEYKNGVLRVILQKREEVKARKIEIRNEQIRSEQAEDVSVKAQVTAAGR